MTVDFDLSQSLVVTGSDEYKLKPVLHLMKTAEAATITGSVSAAIYGAENQATIIVTQDRDDSGNLTSGDEEYTRLVVAKGPSGPTSFSINWLVPKQSYIVEVQILAALYILRLLLEPAFQWRQFVPSTAATLYEKKRSGRRLCLTRACLSCRRLPDH